MKSKKGYVFSVLMVIIATIVLAAILMHIIHKEGAFNRDFGDRAKDLFLAYQDIEKDIFYAEQAAKLANCNKENFTKLLENHDLLKNQSIFDYELLLVNKTCIGLTRGVIDYTLEKTTRYEIRPSFSVKLNK
ncbi:hypothetical protein ACFLZB_01730 [Nanoarchaeota archaeon]